ncbi:ExbD/TolR family protein [Microvirga puerhi]
MGPHGTSGSDDEFSVAPLSEINVTPLVDVMLVLLIIFMVAAPLMTVGIPVQLPKTVPPKVSQPRQPIVVSINDRGDIFLNKEPLTSDSLMLRLRQLAGADLSQVVLVRGDKAALYGRIAEVMGQINAAGFQKVSLIAQAPAGSTP